MPVTLSDIEALFDRPFNDLLFEAHSIHRRHFDPNQVQLSSLLSIKTGGCSEDCAYCPQSAQHGAMDDEPLLPLSQVLAAARAAQAEGAERFCMGAAWRNPQPNDLEKVAEMIRAVKALGLETCATLGMLEPHQAEHLAAAGLDYYNHNLDTSRRFYGNIISTRTYDDRLDTLKSVRRAGIKVCCGGIVGMGESRRDRAGLIAELALLDPPPESVPINLLVQVPGTPLEQVAALDALEFVRTIAVTRIVLATSVVRLSAGRQSMEESLQALCFFAGANSIFYGDRLLTTSNPEAERDRLLLARLGMRAGTVSVA
ncbi:MAG TPA: biotin synthase BioB [Acidiferrobacteraceae bacterium]|nr:biotin synthase BioB [Acidiferrobacteraceae bacterium]